MRYPLLQGFATKKTSRILGSYKCGDGYATVSLSNDEGKRKTMRRSFLVAYLFCPKISPEHNTVDHINRIRDDASSNLRWATLSEQAINREYGLNNSYCRPIIQYDINGKAIMIWDSVTSAGKHMNIDPSYISHACKNRILIGGFYWQYYIMTYQDEKWCQIPFPEYDTLYVSNYGRVMFENGRITEGTVSGKYLFVNVGIKNSTKRAKIQVSRLVAATFFGRNNDLFVNHKNGNTRNNRPENLEYVTRRENSIHAYNTGLNKSARRIAQFDLNGNFMKEYLSIAQAARENNCPASSIRNALTRNGNTYLNFRWYYID